MESLKLSKNTPITDSQRDILNLILDGVTTLREAAQILGLEYQTVKNYMYFLRNDMEAKIGERPANVGGILMWLNKYLEVKD